MDDDVGDGGELLAEFFLEFAGELVRLVSEAVAPTETVMNSTSPVLGRKQAQVARGRVRVALDDGLDRLERVRVVRRPRVGGDRLFERFEMGSDVADGGQGSPIAFSTRSATSWAVARELSAGSLRCSETLCWSPWSKIVMSWASLTAGSLRAIARTRSRRVRPRRRGSTCTTTSLLGSTCSIACSTSSAAACALDHGSAWWDGDDDVGEVASAGLAQAEAVKLDLGAEGGDRVAGDGLGVRGCGVHQNLGVLEDEAARGGEDEAGDDQRRDRVAVAKPGAHGDQADQHRDRSADVAGEVKRVGAQRGGAVPAGAATCDHRAADVDHDRQADDREHVPPRRSASCCAADQPLNGFDDDDQPTPEQDRRLGQRREVLGAAVPERMGFVGRPGAEPDGEERDDGGDDVAGGLDPG